MHIGHFIEQELTKQRLSVADVAKELNKSETAVRKDLKKDALHQSVIDGYSRALNINIYELLAQELKELNITSPKGIMEVAAEPSEEYKKTIRKGKSNGESISVTIQVPASKKAELLNLLTS